MSISNHDKRWQKVFDFLLELGAGNFAMDLPTGQLEDNLDYLAGSLNMLTEELNTILHGLNPEKSYLQSLLLTIIVEDDLHILDIGNRTANKLHYATSELINLPILELIPSEFHKKFNNEFKKFKQGGNAESVPFQLVFKTAEGFLLKVNCQFEFLGQDREKPRYLILGSKILSHNEVLEKGLRKQAIENFKHRKYPTQTRIKLHKDRLQTVNSLHDFIVARLHTNLPKMSVITDEMGASKSKLQAAFKRKYGMGIYAYHRERRLKKAVMLLRNTEKTVETISRECGFVNRTHFSTVFKKRFGYRPTDLRKS